MVPPTALVRGAALVVVGALVVAAVVVPGADPVGVAGALRGISGLTAASAGVALLVRWSVGGRALAGWLGVAFVNVGFFNLALGDVDVFQVGGHSTSGPYGRIAGCALVAGCVVAAVRSPEVNSGLRPMRILAGTALVGLSTLAITDVAFGGGDLSGRYMSASHAVCAVTWLCLAAWVWRAGRRRPGGGAGGAWVVWAVLALGGGNGLATVLAGVPWAPVGEQVGELVGSCLALSAAVYELRWTLRVQDRQAFGDRVVLNGLRAEVQHERSAADARLHDLLNAVVAIRSADSVLKHHAGRLDQATRDSLSDGLSLELSRLQALIEPHRRIQVEEIHLAGVLAPVVAAERARGAHVVVDLGEVRARGDTVGLARVVQNLLANARRHAPGAAVRLSAAERPGRVEIGVSERGPGVARGERLAIFGRDSRGTAGRGAEGAGPGLFVAARLMAEMGGALRLEEAEECGACFVLELPAATRRDAGPIDLTRLAPVSSRRPAG